MTPAEMEVLADMIAARLMGTFAARLDMIEEVLFPDESGNLTVSAGGNCRDSEIKRCLKEGYSVRQTAEIAGCSKTTVMRVKQKGDAF